jgi:glutamate carboxypeptidase
MLPDTQALRRAVDARYRSYLADLRTTVDIDCGTFLPEGVNRVADLMQDRLESSGWTVDRRPHSGEGTDEPLGDVVVATLQGSRSDGRRILLVGHMDTVFPAGTAIERPFAVEGERATGPGTSDMKGGLLAGYYAVRALQDKGFDDFGSITYVCNPDEEIGSPFSGPIILDLARSMSACFVLECGRENGNIVSSRKGVAGLSIEINGRAAHAGVEPERGRSATLQAAHTTIALHGLNGRWPGVTVNVGVVQGGIRPNVVAERCELQVDLRATTQDTFDEALQEIDRAARDTVVPDVAVEVTRMTGSFPPMEKSDASANLIARVKELASELGFDVDDQSTGGASDANPVAALGIPTLDGLGPVGGGAHSREEWLDLSSVVPRVAMLAGLIASAP